jgi:ribonuclease VapC
LIVVDTSALMAVVLNEAEAEHVSSTLENAGQLLMSATTLAECLIVAQMRNVGPEMQQVIDDLGIEIVSTTRSFAERVTRTYMRWGKGAHPAGLNLGDCFAYTLAEERACPLLYVGSNFTKTDIASALARK